MSEVSKQYRSIEEINQEYANTCAKAGSIQYQIHVYERDLDLVNQTLRDLNLEAAASKRAADEKAAEQSKKDSQNG